MLKPEYIELTRLTLHDRNPRTIKKADMDRLIESIKANPDLFEVRPILVSNRTGKLVIIGGNQRYRAAKLIGMKAAPAVIMEGLTEEREREIMIRDNVQNGEWNFNQLANEWDHALLDYWGVPVPTPEPETTNDKPSKAGQEVECPDCGKIFVP